jgi:hypothetical protein
LFLGSRDWIIEQARVEAGVRLGYLNATLVDGSDGGPDGDLLVQGRRHPARTRAGCAASGHALHRRGGRLFEPSLSASFEARFRPRIGPSRLFVEMRRFTITALPRGRTSSVPSLPARNDKSTKLPGKTVKVW